MTMMIAALGVVFGDIGTSPLYALRECFHGAHGIAATVDNIYGVLSLILWSLMMVVTVKYLMFVLRADNRGEGGILALMALVEPKRSTDDGQYKLTWAIALGLFGAALLYGDGIITPAISVLSAVEGLKLATPVLEPYVIPITLAVLVGLFLVQKQGTARIGRAFGPIMIAWFATLAVMGVFGIMHMPSVLYAVNPWYAVRFMIDNGWHGIVVLGSVVLVVTGGEALYADMSHFGRKPIARGWFYIALPALVLQYFGQGALVLEHPESITNPFYNLAPSWATYPLVALATAAAVIASQALITGAFSLSHGAVRLGFLPRLTIVQTSAREIGQIYVPAVNWALFVGTILLVLGFGSSTNLAGAYGIAVTCTMVITAILLHSVTVHLWHWSQAKAAALLVLFLAIDLPFLAGNLVKVPSGGWLPLAIACAVFFLMITWKRGRVILNARINEGAPPLVEFLKSLAAKGLARVTGTAVFMTSTPTGTPIALSQNIRHNKTIHERNVVLTIVTRDIPHVPHAERLRIEDLTLGFQRLTVSYGFMDVPDVPRSLFDPEAPPLGIELDDTTFFLGQEILIATDRPGMAIFREKMFAFLARNSQRASTYYRLPSDRVIQVGGVLEL